MTLQEFFLRCPKAAVAFSGGVDSSYLLQAGLKYGADLQPYLVKSAFQPEFELEDARRLAPQVTVLSLDVLRDPAIAANPADRCYYCKRRIFEALIRQAHADGYEVILDGTNASDDLADRPGVRALRELGVQSPLRLCGLTKEEIRCRSKELGLFTWDKPAYACLATRVPTGVPLTRELLARVEGAEAALLALGYRDFRVRVFHDAARIQLQPEQFPRDPAQYQALRRAAAPYFDPVLLDLAPRG